MLTTVLVTATVTLLLCPLVVRQLLRSNRVDVPGSRSSHATPTPRGGGAAIVGGMLASALVVGARDGGWSTASWVAVAGAVGLAAVGWTDDSVGLSPHVRLWLQMFTGAVVGGFVAGPWGVVLGIVVVPGAVNMVNFMDGIDGLAGSHAVVWGAGALVAATVGGGPTLAVLGALSLGGGLGFLPWNAYHPRVFLGDVGSYVLGALAGFGVVLSVSAAADSADALPLLGLVCAPYLLFALDTAWAIVRRAQAGESLFQAHRSHHYQRLVNEGALPHWVVSLAITLLSATVTLAFAIGWRVGLAAAIVVGAVYVLAPRAVADRVLA